ncbi:hypothetical protein SS50377_28437 [Spironucleus salmonicida]|uniref:Uncharacterized protein n=1 Tax=Spironucleus salmonicida TaxID=348837 RepID=V6LR24_9EUKA|nr:hypothetical protein SS50377_28437 [Spironucleus salmonicida]|eukprot:EST43209.1 Hypothetical protein SS50377_17153 [Spironucleus salmonicida]
MIPKLNIPTNPTSLPIKPSSSFHSLLSNRTFEHLSEIKLTDVATNSKFKLGLTILHMLNTSSHYEVLTSRDGQNYKTSKVVTPEMVDMFAMQLRIKPEVMQKTLDTCKEDQLWQNELGSCYFAVLNYLDKHYKTSQIWEVENPWKLLDGKYFKDLEMEFEKVMKATPRSFRM